jgi:hypothetical protein
LKKKRGDHVDGFNKARTQYEENQSNYDAYLADEANRLKVELVAANDRLEDQYFRRMIWKLLFVISFGINVGLWIGGL